MTTANSNGGECIGNITFASNQHSACPAAVTTDYTNEVQDLEGPVPAGGGSVTNLVGTTNNAVSGTGAWLIEVVDNNTGTTLLSCTISVGTGGTSCQNTGSAAVSAGHYLMVRVSRSGSPLPSGSQFRVSFRY
jgi:hypothetical protein